jgi:hypothetical protein
MDLVIFLSIVNKKSYLAFVGGYINDLDFNYEFGLVFSNLKIDYV